ncbi:MAG: UDP-N-acetylglucosamine 2-epimerase (non-hydrolyzing) [Desulfobacteraceae bacterium]|nr:UDP-N-acetylglucosamine 2-epimerase (non-hydrolyzing) [Desulfobacteraceae bacterium]
MNIITIIGARPQFIKAATVSRAISAHNARIPSDPRLTNNCSPITETLIHTGQHFDAGMSDIFFEELGIPEPDYHLGISGGGHGAMTGAMLEKLEPQLQEISPDWVLVYGDTNSTLAGALVAAKLHIPVAHVEAGLRSYNRGMPEEINRIVTDQLSTVLFCPTETAIRNLEAEGFPHRLGPDSAQEIVDSGDVMFDAALFYAKRAEGKSGILAANGLEPKGYILATVHRAENTDDPLRLRAIVEGLDAAAEQMPVVLPLHPRTKAAMERETLRPQKIKLIDPVGYLDMVALETNAAVIATDSGGVQKEAYFHGVPSVTLRDETEWTELVEAGWNRLAPPGKADIGEAIGGALGSKGREVRPYGKGWAAEVIAGKLAMQNHISEASKSDL